MIVQIDIDCRLFMSPPFFNVLLVIAYYAIVLDCIWLFTILVTSHFVL